MRAWRKRFTHKETYTYYKGQMIGRNSPYCYGLGNGAVMLGYGPDGNECYFSSISQAKRFIDRHWAEYIEREKQDPFSFFNFVYDEKEEKFHDGDDYSPVDDMDARNFERIQEALWNTVF